MNITSRLSDDGNNRQLQAALLDILKMWGRFGIPPPQPCMPIRFMSEEC